MGARGFTVIEPGTNNAVLRFRQPEASDPDKPKRSASADAMRLYRLRNPRCAEQPLNKSVSVCGAEAPCDWFTLNIDRIGSVLSGFFGDLYHELRPSSM